MMQGYPLSATLPEDFGLGERFWYWRGLSGQSYIHSIYSFDLCPAVSGAVYVLVRKSLGHREAIAVGRFGSDGRIPTHAGLNGGEEEVHVHLLARDEAAAEAVRHDLAGMMEDGREATARQVPDTRAWTKPVQPDLLAA